MGGLYEDALRVEYWKVVSDDDMHIAMVKVNGELGVAEGVGPVHAIDRALRSIASRLFPPELNNVRLTDYRVILPGEVKSTESVVRVLMEFSDGKVSWRTVGVSTSIITASVEALVDGLNYILMIYNYKGK